MILGILRETKKGESRVICTPKEVETITSAGHTVYAQRGCGERAGFSDEAYESAGALLTDSCRSCSRSAIWLPRSRSLRRRNGR